MHDKTDHFARHHPLLTALALSMGAAISLGLARFAYALLLPPMREDLGWSYLLAGGMNTANAVGYLIGALATPALMRRLGVHAMLIGGAVLTAAFMLMSGFVIDATALMAQRMFAGIASAFIFIAGGVLAARLGAMHAPRAGFLIGLYYGGTGFGIALSALLVPMAIDIAASQGASHAWQWAWLLLAVLSMAAAAAMMLPARHIDGTVSTQAKHKGFPLRPFVYGLAGYFLFGVGYIGYMTFILALLKEQGMSPVAITVFYAVLGIATVASSRLWSRLLDHFKGGQAMALLNALLGMATLLPVFLSSPAWVFLSGLLFGAVFLSVVASTTALVRHNLDPAAWPGGISMFTTVFAFGQIAGPAMVGWIADGPGGLRRGLVFSACALLLGALLAMRQRPLPKTPAAPL